MKLAERRRVPRVTPDPLAVIRLPAGIGGVLLDISTLGLGFLASAPVAASPSIELSLGVKSVEDLEVTGEVIWMNGTGTRGGVRFTHVPAEVLEQVEAWLGQRQTDRAVESQRGGFDESFDAEPEFRSRASRTRVNASSSDHESSGGRRIVIDAIVVLLAFCAALGIWSSIYRREAAETLLTARKGILTTVGRVSAAWRVFHPIAKSGTLPPSPAIVTSPPTDLNPAPAGNQKPLPELEEQNPSRSADLPLPSPVEQPPSLPKAVGPSIVSGTVKKNSGPIITPAAISATPKKGLAELAMARRLLRDGATPEELVQGARQLWAAVEKGNQDAEMELADLYVNGRGVPRNCDQARVLLTAASQANNARAIDKLKDLHRTCP